MSAAPILDTGGDVHLLHTTQSYLYDQDCLLDLLRESELIHEGHYSSAQLIYQLERDTRFALHHGS